MQTPPFQLSSGEIQDTQMKPNATTAASRPSRTRGEAVNLVTDARRPLACDLSPLPNEYQTETTAKSAAANPTNQNNLGNCKEPVKPDVGAELLPAGPVMTATTRTAPTHMASRRAQALRAGRRARLSGAAPRTGPSPVRGHAPGPG